MKHLNNFQLYELKKGGQEYFEVEGFQLLNSLMKTFKQRYDILIDLANKHNYTLLKEFVQLKREWEIFLVFESNLEAVEEIRRNQWRAFADDHNELMSTEDPFSKRRFMSHANLEHWDIQDWEKSKTLTKTNNQTGIFENHFTFLEKNLTVKAYLDWS